MGCVAPKQINNKDNVIGILTERDQNVYQKLQSQLNFDHHNNINRKFNFLMKIYPHKTSGDGIFKTQGYYFIGTEK